METTRRPDVEKSVFKRSIRRDSLSHAVGISTRLMIEQDEIWQHTGEIRPIPRSLERRSAILSHLGFDQAIRDFNIIG